MRTFRTIQDISKGDDRRPFLVSELAHLTRLSREQVRLDIVSGKLRPMAGGTSGAGQRSRYVIAFDAAIEYLVSLGELRNAAERIAR
jgi:hypothetical protein